MELFNKNVRRGDEAILETSVAEFPDGTPISVTVRAISGSRDGPRLVLLGAQHGDEYSGMEIINRLMDSLDPGDLSGEVVAVPVSNPLAFNTAGRVTPPSIGYENLNLNRVWPGNPKGLLMERVAAALWEQLIMGSDAILDLHEGGKAFMAKYIHARGTEDTDRIVGDRIRRLYQSFGQGIPVLGGVRTRSHMMGSLSIQAGLVGIPCIGAELGGARNVMVDLGMLQEEPVGSFEEQIVAQVSTWPKTSHGGVIYNSCDLGDVVEKEEVLGVLRDIAGRFLEEIHAPYRSVIFDTRYQPTVYPGDWTFHCGKVG
jgi:predicted deacylase